MGDLVQSNRARTQTLRSEKSASHLLNVEGRAETKKEAEARENVVQVFNSMLAREPSAAEFFHFRGCMLEGELDKVSLSQQISKTIEYCDINERIAGLNLEYRYWANPFYPWMCVDDQADEECGTVRWEQNEMMAGDNNWYTKDVPPGNSGAQVLDGKLFVSNRDVWISVAASTGFTAGKHIWHVKKKSG
jgi:hypothetical protein